MKAAPMKVRERVIAWASLKGFPIVDSRVEVAVSGGIVRIPLFSLTDELAVIRAVAAEPLPGSLRVEPRGLSHRLRARVQSSRPPPLEDPVFAEKWSIEASDAPLSQELVDDAVRVALLALAAADVWCSVRYADGEIEIRLDAAALDGAHLLGGIDVATAMLRPRPRSRVPETPYR